MPIVAVVVGAIGTAVGTAIGTAIGGTILGVSAATIGGVIGAGIAGGALAAATGGSFGKGFLMGAAGSALGSFLKGGLGDTIGGATQAADGTTVAGMLAEQGGAEFAPDAFSSMGDLGATGASVGLGELGGVGVDSTGGVETFGLGDTAIPEGTPIGTEAPSWEAGLQDIANQTQFGDLSGGTDLASSAGFNAQTPVTGNDIYSNYIPGSDSNSPLLSSDYSFSPEVSSASPTAGTLDNIGQGYVQPPDGTTTSQMLQSQGMPLEAPKQGGLGGMFKSSDAWLKNTLGQNAPSTGKLLMGGGQYLMDKYQTDKLARQAKGLAPMSFEEYKTQFTNPQDYRTASAKLAQSGRTGTLPALLARMNERARQGYAGYLPGAQEKYLGVKADIAGARSRSLGNLFRNVMA